MSDLRLGMIQMNSAVKDRDGNVEKASGLIDQAVAEGAQLVVLPEFFNTEYFAQYWDNSYVDYAEPADGYTITRMQSKAAEHGIHLAATIYEHEAPGLNYDTTFMIDPTGKIIGKYRKVHPAAVRSLETLFYRRGNRFPVWDVRGVKVGVVICYDHVFPETVRSAAVHGAELVIGPFATNGIPGWDALMTTRAFENGVYMAPCNKVGPEDGWTFTGRSMVVDPFGEIVHRASDTEDEVFVVDIDRARIVEARTRFPFLRDRRPEAYGALVSDDETARSLPTHL
jgi:N-carbamoylputrescine amidase